MKPFRYMLAALPLLALAAPFQQAQAAPAAANFHVLSRIKLGGDTGWDYLRFDAQRRHLFVSHGDRVLVLDMDTHKQIGSIPDTSGVHGIALAPALHRGFTSNGKSASVTMFDLDSLKVLATITGTGKKPDAIVYDPASGHVLTFNGNSDTASVIDPEQRAVIDTIALPGRPEFAVSDGIGHVYVNIEDISTLVEIDSRRNKAMHSWPLASCRSPSGLAMDTAHHRLFSVCDNRIMAVTDAIDGRQIATVPIGDGPDAVTFDAARSMIYSSNGDSGTITAVHEDDADQFSVTATIPTQLSARTLALDPKLDRLYLSAARFGVAQKAGERAPIKPGSFAVLVVGAH